MTKADWLTLAAFVAIISVLAQFSPDGALKLALVAGVIIGVRALPVNQTVEQKQ